MCFWGLGGQCVRSDKTQKPDMTRKTSGKKVHSKDQDMGAALRSVYQKTIDEAIPDDLLDLLGKLG